MRGVSLIFDDRCGSYSLSCMSEVCCCSLSLLHLVCHAQHKHVHAAVNTSLGKSPTWWAGSPGMTLSAYKNSAVHGEFLGQVLGVFV